jgi:thioredoxin-dependent peroxiredoxin
VLTHKDGYKIIKSTTIMATITLKGNSIQTSGALPEIGKAAPDAELVKTDLSRIRLKDYFGTKLILNIFPSIDTNVCAKSVKTFNERATEYKDAKVICISRDLPFAQVRFSEAMGITNVIMLSDFAKQEFGKKYNLEITDGPMTGLLSRVVIVIDQHGKIVYHEQVGEIGNEPDYLEALVALRKIS